VEKATVPTHRRGRTTAAASQKMTGALGLRRVGASHLMNAVRKQATKSKDEKGRIDLLFY